MKKFSLILTVSFLFALSKSAHAEVLFSEPFNYPSGLITNEYAFYNPNAAGAKKSNVWEITSGSLFENGGAGWTGVPNDGAVNATSSPGNDSCVFRMTSVRHDFGDVEVSMSLLNQGVSSTKRTPPMDWDGLHFWLRYQNEANMYYASMNRRDNTVIIKKKVPGGPSNGGTYYSLTKPAPFHVPYGVWQQIKASVKNNPDGSVTIKLYNNGVLLTSVTDNGTVGGPPIRNPGKVGMRGDNANLKFDNFTVTSLTPPAPSAPSSPTGVVAAGGDSVVSIKWNPVPGATSYNLYRSRNPGVSKTTGYKIAGVKAPFLNTGFTNGTVYYMVVTAVNAGGESKESAEVSARPYRGGPARPFGDPDFTISGAGTFGVYPNPWRQDRNSGAPVTFSAISPGSDVRIFTVAGQEVTTLQANAGSATWDLRNDSGEQVASGVYLYMLTKATGEKLHGTLAVIR